mgnify:CR=1 FL=1
MPKKADVEELLLVLIAQGEHIMADLTALTTAVSANTDAVNAAVAALGAITPDQQPEVDALTATVEANNAALTGATPV